MTHLQILQELRSENKLTEVEKNLLDINMQFLKSDLPILQETGKSGIETLMMHVHYKAILKNFPHVTNIVFC